MLHKRFDFTRPGGFPLTQDVLDYMQNGYSEAIQALVGVLGDNMILSGAAYNGTCFMDGWVINNGEVLPFVGGTASFSGNPNSVSISVFETSELLVFDGNTPKAVKFSRFVGLGAGGQNPKTLADLKSVATHKKSGQMLYKSGAMEVENVTLIKIPIGAGIAINITSLNPVLKIMTQNSSNNWVLGNPEDIAMSFVYENYTWYLSAGVIRGIIGSGRVVYHIFQDTTHL